MTDATGRSFLSYRRTHLEEARLLVQGQHDHSILTWQGLYNLDEAHVDATLRQLLPRSAHANAAVWPTADMEESPTITRIELPPILDLRYSATDPSSSLWLPVDCAAL